MDWNMLSGMLPHLRIVHHVRGRLRVRLLPDALAYSPALNRLKPEEWLKRIPGVLDARLNPVAASLVIQYDAARLQPQWWERLAGASGQELPGLLAEVGIIQPAERSQSIA